MAGQEIRTQELNSTQLEQMRAIADLLHEPLIKGEKTPSLSVIQDLLAKQES